MRAACLLLLACLVPASAQEADRERIDFLGWNKACGLALAHFGFPKRGEAIDDEPVMTRIGAMTIAPGREEAKTRWRAAWEGELSWKKEEAERLEEGLKLAGYSTPGLEETVRPYPVAQGRDLDRVLLSTEAFRTRAVSGFPGPGWRLASVRYSPLDACALLVYAESGTPRDHFFPLLVRIGDPGARLRRAAAHVTNALLLFQSGDAPGALAESAIAAGMAPESAAAHYHRAALLALSGASEEALPELENAVKLDRKYRDKARDDKDFESLSWTPRFKGLTRPGRSDNN